MPIFARRRLQDMLAAIAEYSDQAKMRDLLARVNEKRTKTAIAGEMELALLWAIQEVAHLDVEPLSIAGASRPDAMSHNLFGNMPAVIDITTLSDDFMGGEEAMRKVATRIAQFANTIKKKADNHLYFDFQEESGHDIGGFFRRRLVSSSHTLTESQKASIRTWLEGGTPASSTALRIKDESVDVYIQWRENVDPRFNFFSTMPAVTYSLEDNTLFKALRAKQAQLKNVPRDYLRCVFVADGGCSLLRNLRPIQHGREVSGEDIIRHFLVDSRIDVVCVFSPTRSTSALDKRGTLSWSLHAFGGPNDLRTLNEMKDALPAPRFEGYQARSLHLQKAFDPKRQRWYVGSYVTSSKEKMIVKLSARALHELLAGQLDYESFESFTSFESVFKAQLQQGKTISSVKLESGGLDEDDDYVVFEFEPDPSASDLVT